MEENHEFKECHCDEHKTEHWVKFALLLLALFVACYLAVYYVLDQMRHAYYVPVAPMQNIDRILQEQDKMFQDMGVLPMHNKAIMHIKSPVETFKDDDTDTYKIVIDLKPFNNNPKNVEVSIQPNNVSIKGAEDKMKRHSENLYVFSQSFVFPEKIKVKDVQKEVKHHRLIYTLPVDDD